MSSAVSLSMGTGAGPTPEDEAGSSKDGQGSRGRHLGTLQLQLRIRYYYGLVQIQGFNTPKHVCISAVTGAPPARAHSSPQKYRSPKLGATKVGQPASSPAAVVPTPPW